MINEVTSKPNSFILHGDLCYCKNSHSLQCIQNGYLICIDGLSQGAFEVLPERYTNLPRYDYGGKLIIPGLVDLHMHAPQFAFRGLGMDLELLDWLNTYAYPEEVKYSDIDYARQAYNSMVLNLIRGPNTRSCLYATVHLPATQQLMDLLESSGLVCMVGKVNMDRNCPEYIREKSAADSIADTRRWLEHCGGRYKNVYPILTPRFIPTCSDELMRGLAALQAEFSIPVQSHLSENRDEIDWVLRLVQSSKFYGDAYDGFGLFGGDVPTVMAHCVWPDDNEIELIRKKGVYVAHCPQSNENLTSGIAPVRQLLNRGVSVGLGSDVAGGCHSSIFRAMADAIQVSKLRRLFVNQEDLPLTIEEAFYLGTLGGGSFFGNVGSFEAGYELDALVIDDLSLRAPFSLLIKQRLELLVYLSNDSHIFKKYIRGRSVFQLYQQREAALC